MNKQQIELWRQRLIEEEARLSGQIGKADIAELDDPSVALRILAVRKDTLAHVREAIQRCDKGSYGTCQVCGHEIEQERLGVVPYATTCAACTHSAQASRLRQEMAQQGQTALPRRMEKREGQADENGTEHIYPLGGLWR